MRKFLILALILGAAGGVAAATLAQPTLYKLDAGFTEAASRPCIFSSGGWTTVDCSAVAAAASGNLNEWSRYIIQCTDDSYLSFDGTTADANDGYLPNGEWLWMISTPTEKSFSCLNVNVDADCRYIECK
jgi:hypothetical protein